MFNLKLGSAKNLAKWPPSTSGASANSGNGSQKSQGTDSDLKNSLAAAGAAIGSTWFRSTSGASSTIGFTANDSSKGGNLRKLDSSAAVNGKDKHELTENNFDDPLIYRLQHQKRYQEEKKNNQSSRRSHRSSRSSQRRRRSSISGHPSPGSMKRSFAERSDSSRGRQKQQQDPFDLWGSLSSEEDSDGRNMKQSQHSTTDESNRSGVDVVGWGNSASNRSPIVQRRPSGQMLSDFEDDDDSDCGLVVDFGGVTPLELRHDKRRNGSAIAIPTPPNFSPPPARHSVVSSAYRPKRIYGENHSTNNSFHSKCSDRDDKGGDGSLLSAQSRASHADLENILSSLEAASESMSPMGAEPNNKGQDSRGCSDLSGPETQDGPGSKTSCVSSLSSPVEQYRRQLEGIHIPSAERISALPLTKSSSSSGSSDMVFAKSSVLEPPPPQDRQRRYNRQRNQPSQLPLDDQWDEREQQLQFSAQISPQHQQSNLPITPQQSPYQQSMPSHKPQPPPRLGKTVNAGDQVTYTQHQHTTLSSQEKQPPPKQTPKPPIIQQEEEDPILAQLKQQTTEELRSELSKMQWQSKTNLEQSWAATEKMRVEHSELDEKFDKIRKELAVARAGLISGVSSATSFSGGSSGRRRRQVAKSDGNRQSIVTKFSPPRTSDDACNKSKFRRRRRTIDGSISGSMLSDIISIGDSSLNSRIGLPGRSVKKATSVKSLGALEKNDDDDDDDDDDIQSPSKTGNPYSRIKSTGAIGALMGKNGLDTSNEVSNDGSYGGRRGLLANLSKSFRRSASSKCSANDFQLNDMDDDGSDLDNSNAMEEVPQSISAMSNRKSMLRRNGMHYMKHDNSSSRDDYLPFAQDNDDRGAYRSGSGDDSSDAQSGVSYDSGDDSSDAKHGIFYPPPRDYNSGDESSDAQSGVFYPKPLSPSDDEQVEQQELENTRRGAPRARKPSYADSSVSISALSEMDDFDFDPLGESNFIVTRKEPIKAKESKQRGSNKSTEGKGKRAPFARRPSFMNLFEEKPDESDTDSFHSLPMMESLQNSKKNKNKKKEEIAEIEETIVKKDDEIIYLNKSIHIQEETKLCTESEIESANAQNTESEGQLHEKESKLQLEVHELEQRGGGINERLDSAEGSEQLARERETALKEELVLIQENLHENEGEENSEHRLSYFREQYETLQEKAISSLSGLLDDFDAIRIPSLRGEFEDDVSDDITSLFDALTDKEEELVIILSDGTRLASCQTAFQQIQKNIEMAMYYKNGLTNLKLELRSYYDTITMLIKHECGDENTTTTESSGMSERLGLERSFVQSILGQLEPPQRNEGKSDSTTVVPAAMRVLDALILGVELLTHWDQLLLPDFDTESSSSAHDSEASESMPTSENLDEVVTTIARAKTELAEVILGVFDEQEKFRAKMYSVFLNSSRSKCDHQIRDDSEHQQHPKKETNGDEELSKQIFGHIYSAESLLSERESLMNNYSSFFNDSKQFLPAREAPSKFKFQSLHSIFEEDETGDSKQQLEELNGQISTATIILSENESLMKNYSLELDLMQARASEDAKANAQLVNEVQMKINHILTKMAEEERMISSLESLLREKRETVKVLESRLFAMHNQMP